MGLSRFIELFAMLVALPLASSFMVLALSFVFDSERLLGKVGDFVRRLAGPFWSKPLVDCPPCMASFWGSIIYFVASISIFQHSDFLFSVSIWPVVILLDTGLLLVLSGIAYGCEECKECDETEYPEQLL